MYVYCKDVFQLFKPGMGDNGSKIETSQKKLSDFYVTDCITRASPTMAKCVKAASEAQKEFGPL